MDEIIDDVITKRLNTCSTYSEVPDLIEIPIDVPMIIIKETLKQKIFRIIGEFSCGYMKRNYNFP